PARLGTSSRTHRVPGVLARRLGGIGGKGALGRGHLIGAPGLAARELPTHEQLVGLAHPYACGRLAHAALPSREGDRPCRPPSRPYPDSLYSPNGLVGSNRLKVFAQTTPARIASAIARARESFSHQIPDE